MSVYGDLLREVVTTEEEESDRPVSDLVSAVIARRAAIGAEPTVGEPRTSAASSRLGDLLYYDAALVTLCDRLGVDHDLVGPHAGPAARHAAERRLAARLPALSETLVETSRPSERSRPSGTSGPSDTSGPSGTSGPSDTSTDPPPRRSER